MNTLKIGIYALLQKELTIMRLLDDQGVPIKLKKYFIGSNGEKETVQLYHRDLLYLYNYLSIEMKGVTHAQLKLGALEFQHLLKNLINDDTEANLTRLALVLVTLEYDDILICTSKAFRVMDEMIKNGIDKRIVKNSYRLADNIYRMSKGELQLPDACRGLFL